MARDEVPEHGNETESVLVRATRLAARAPEPAKLGKILAGTAGWTDPTLVKSKLFYPKGVSSAEDRLKFYATQFPMVEVDASYYALPTPTNAERWVERTPDGFVFNMKAFAGMTGHPVEWARLPKDLQSAIPDSLRKNPRIYPSDLPVEVRSAIWERFGLALQPLSKSGKLGCVLLQYPPWFTATRGNVRVIEEARESLPDVHLAVEFRHASWGDTSRLPRVIEHLRELKMSYVSVDEPQGTLRSMPPTLGVADRRLALVRFHGRRSETWDRAASVQEKFDYLYDPAELAPWIPKVQALADEADEVHLVFNNCVSNKAVLGAKDLVALLAAE